MCEIVEISDDEDSFLLENDVVVTPKDEDLDYHLTPQNMCSRLGVDNVASSSGSNLRSSFIGMGFAPSLVDKAMEENGEGNPELLLETLFAYSDLQKLKTEIFDDCLFNEVNDNLAGNLHARKTSHLSEPLESLDSLLGEGTNAHCNIPLKKERDVGSGDGDEKMASLLNMNFSVDEVGFAMNRLGKHAPIGQLMDFIFAARMAKKYEKDPVNPFPGTEDAEKDGNNDALFGIMEKTLQLLEMGFSENGISAAFEKCGSEASMPVLAESIVAAGTGPDADKYFKEVLSNSSAQRSSQSLKRKMGNWESLCMKTEDIDVVSHVGPSDLLDKLKDKEPIVEAQTDIWKKPKEEFMEEPSSSVGRIWLESKRGSYTSISNPLAAFQRRVGHTESLEEDRKPTIPIFPRRTLSSMVAKPPYFLYGNVTNLSEGSWVKISQFLYSVQPEFANSQLYSAMNKTEGYVHNLPTEDRSHIFPRGPMTIQEAIPHTKKCWPLWDDRKKFRYITCETSGISHLCDVLGRMLVECKGLPSSELQRDILQQCRANNLIWAGNQKLGALEPEHVECIMGYPVHHTRAAGFTSTDRLKALALSFQTDTLGYHLSALKRLFPSGITVLSFFSGIGGAEVALHRLGIRLKAVVSVELNETKRRIVKKWWEDSVQSGELIQFESINKLSSNKIDELFRKFKGFDLIICQNPYSGADSASLAGLDFSMFAEFVRVLQRVRSTIERNS